VKKASWRSSLWHLRCSDAPSWVFVETLALSPPETGPVFFAQFCSRSSSRSGIPIKRAAEQGAAIPLAPLSSTLQTRCKAPLSLFERENHQTIHCTHQRSPCKLLLQRSQYPWKSLPLIRRPGEAQLPYEMDPYGPKNRFYVWFQGRANYSVLQLFCQS
jgi:hypothetical protein